MFFAIVRPFLFNWIFLGLIMPRKGKRKSSFGRTSESDGAKRFAKHSQEQDAYNENKAKQMRIKRWVPLKNFLFIFSFILMLNNPVNSCHKKQKESLMSIMMRFDTIAKSCQFMSKSNSGQNMTFFNRVNSRQSQVQDKTW